MRSSQRVASLCWIIHKDLVSEYRARRVWPTMLLLGTVVVFVFSVQMDLLPHQKERLVGGLLWLAVFFAGMTAIDRSFGGEREDGCWEGLKLLPISPGVIYLAKLAVNLVALTLLECLLIPLFFLLADLALLPHAVPLLSVAVLANLGLAGVGTLVSALASGGGRSGSMLVLLVLPLSMPVLLAAAECTRLVVEVGTNDAWWRWVQLLGVFAVIFITAGTLLFEYAIED